MKKIKRIRKTLGLKKWYENIKIFLLYFKAAESLRCLRDAGFHWAFIFIALVPLVGPIALIVMLAWPSKKDEDTDTEEQDQITA